MLYIYDICVFIRIHVNSYGFTSFFELLITWPDTSLNRTSRGTVELSREEMESTSHHIEAITSRSPDWQCINTRQIMYIYLRTFTIKINQVLVNITCIIDYRSLFHDSCSTFAVPLHHSLVQLGQEPCSWTSRIWSSESQHFVTRCHFLGEIRRWWWWLKSQPPNHLGRMVQKPLVNNGRFQLPSQPQLVSWSRSSGCHQQSRCEKSPPPEKQKHLYDILLVWRIF